MSKFNHILRGITPYHDFNLIKKKAERENKIIKYWKYFIGRTDWDRNYLKLINPDAIYFHCEEILRKEFYNKHWIQPSEIHNDKIIIGTAIFPNPYKGLDLIYKVVNILQDYNINWKIIGIDKENSLNKIFTKYLKIKKKVTNIEFCGLASAEELIKHLLTCHFFVHPSYIDNSSNSVCEAMLLGMPVLSSFVGGLKTLIKNGETGFLFNPYDKYDLAGLIIYLIENYEQAKKAGVKAREIALKRNSPHEIINELNAIYNFIYNQELNH